MNSGSQINPLATKKAYHKPNVQVYGTLAQMTATSTVGANTQTQDGTFPASGSRRT
jgi:hypothetical protein